jgi:putative PIN family toxin of toxin-antitoxin system
MLIVVDTNVLISGLLWLGLPHRLIELAEEGSITICATGETLEELRGVLGRPKFRQAIRMRRSSIEEIMLGIVQLVALYPAPSVVRVVVVDPDDDIFVACALSAGARYIVSGDDHLLRLGKYKDIEILTVRDFLEREFPDSLW